MSGRILVLNISIGEATCSGKRFMENNLNRVVEKSRKGLRWHVRYILVCKIKIDATRSIKKKDGVSLGFNYPRCQFVNLPIYQIANLSNYPCCQFVN